MVFGFKKGKKKLSAEDAAALFQAEHDRLASSSGTVAYKAPEEDVLPPNTGPGPSGTLTILKTKVACPGCEPACGTIKLEYKIPDGIQFGYHPHPGEGCFAGDVKALTTVGLIVH